MPLVTLTLGQHQPVPLRGAILEAVHRALVDSGVPEADRFHRVLALAPDEVRFDARYPDLTRERGLDFALIEILWSAGRSVKVKKKLLAGLMASLTELGLDTEQVMVCFVETTWENWSFGGGRLLHA